MLFIVAWLLLFPGTIVQGDSSFPPGGNVGGQPPLAGGLEMAADKFEDVA